jgi:hypothetical protein
VIQSRLPRWPDRDKIPPQDIPDKIVYFPKKSVDRPVSSWRRGLAHVWRIIRG